MRALVDRSRINKLLEALGRQADASARVYLVGGSSAVMIGWRASTVDVDLVMRPELEDVLKTIPAIKEDLGVNVELASPLDFIPVPPGWEERSPFVAKYGSLSVHHFDFYGQALAKIERGHRLDVEDVREMLSRGLVQRNQLGEMFTTIAPLLHRFPAIDAPTFKRAVEAITSG